MSLSIYQVAVDRGPRFQVNFRGRWLPQTFRCLQRIFRTNSWCCRGCLTWLVCYSPSGSGSCALPFLLSGNTALWLARRSSVESPLPSRPIRSEIVLQHSHSLQKPDSAPGETGNTSKPSCFDFGQSSSVVEIFQPVSSHFRLWWWWFSIIMERRVRYEVVGIFLWEGSW